MKDGELCLTQSTAIMKVREAIDGIIIDHYKWFINLYEYLYRIGYTDPITYRIFVSEDFGTISVVFLNIITS